MLCSVTDTPLGRKAVGDESVVCGCPAGRHRATVMLPGGLLRLLDRSRGCAVRADGLPAVHGRAGEDTGRTCSCARTPARARRVVRRSQPGPHRGRPAAAGAGLGAAAAGGGRPAGPGCGRLAMAAARRRHQRCPLVLSHLRPRREQAPDDPGLALLVDRRPGDGPLLVDRAPGRCAAAAGRRPRRRDRHPGAGPGRAPDHGRPVARGRPTCLDRGRRRLRRDASGLPPAGPARRTPRAPPLGPGHAPPRTPARSSARSRPRSPASAVWRTAAGPRS